MKTTEDANHVAAALASYFTFCREHNSIGDVIEYLQNPEHTNGIADIACEVQEHYDEAGELGVINLEDRLTVAALEAGIRYHVALYQLHADRQVRPFPPKIIRDWVNGGGVHSGNLAAELEYWADYVRENMT